MLDRSNHVAAPHAATTDHEGLCPDVERHGFLPLVSVVLVNFNYGHFLERALQSVRDQTYPRIETVLIDDCSTDDSRERIESLCRMGGPFERTKIVLMEQNLGQTSCCARGVAESTGPYVLFLDADDQLLPEAVEAHVYAHLSSRIAIAFTSVDMLNNVRGQDVNTSSSGFANHVASNMGRRPAFIRPIDKVAPATWFGGHRPVVSMDDLHFVLAPHADPWVWSPCSANCFRREALVPLLAGTLDESLPRWGTDSYLIRPLTALHGALLIDRPLVRYMIHGDNLFATGAPLAGVFMYDLPSKKADMAEMLRVAVYKLMAGAATSGHRYESPHVFFSAMRALTCCWPGLDREGEDGRFYREQLATHRAALVAGFGRDVVDEEIAGTQLALPEPTPGRFDLLSWLGRSLGR